MSQEERQLFVAWILLAAMVAIGFFAGLHGEFTYDDKVEVIGNETVRSASNWRSIFEYNWARPLVLGSFAINYQVGGIDPFSYHLFNMILHVANVGLALLVIRQWLQLAKIPNVLFLSFTAAAIWAIHPLATESVVYVTGRSELMVGFFALYGFWLWNRWLLNGGLLLYWGAWLAVVGAGLCKESAAVVPVIYWLTARFLRPPEKQGVSGWFLLLPGLAMLLGYAGIRWTLEGTLGHPNPQRDMTTQLLTQLEVVWAYIRLALVPVGQSIFHDYPEAQLGIRPLIAGLGLLLVGIYGFRKRRSDPVPVFGALFFLVWISPTVFIPLKETMAEHRTYLGLLGLTLIVVYGLSAFAQKIQRSLSFASIGVLLALCIARSHVWKTEIRLWEDAAAKSPDSAEAHYGVGEAHFYSAARMDLSEKERSQLNPVKGYKRAVELDDGYVEAWNKLGIAHAQRGEIFLAIGAWQALLSIDPKHCKAHTNLGKTFVMRGETVKGLRELEAAVSYCPNHALPHYFLGLLYQSELDDPDKAIFHFQRLLGLEPDFECPFGKEVEGQFCVAEDVRQMLNDLTW